MKNPLPALHLARHFVVLSLPFLLAATTGAANGAVEPPVPASSSSKASAEISTETPHVGVHAAPGQRVVLATVVRGAHQDFVRQHTLPESFRVEETPFRIDELPREDAEDRFHRIVYHSRGKDFIAGVVDHYVVLHGDFTQDDSTLTNVAFGYDRETRKFWLHADPAQMPPVPQPFQVTHRWPGKRFLIPLELERHSLESVKSQIKVRGGSVVTCCEGSVDVVLLPDDVDFVWTRNKSAEQWIRRGAEVLWEKDFPQPCR